jgi:hypothetical protein
VAIITRIMVGMPGIPTVIGVVPAVVVTFIVFAGYTTMESGFGFVDKGVTTKKFPFGARLAAKRGANARSHRPCEMQAQIKRKSLLRPR